MAEAYGRKEVAEAVVIAALSTLVTGLLTWAIDAIKEFTSKSKENEEHGPKEG